MRTDLLAALGLVPVLGNIPPFAWQAVWTDNRRRVADLEDRTLRVIGLGGMFPGMVLIRWARG